MNTRSVVVKVRAALARKATARRELQRLERELADYRTPSERLDLDEMISRYPTEETREIRAILARLDSHAAHRGRVAVHR